MESTPCIDELKAALERAYAELGSRLLADDVDRVLLEIERLEAALLDRYDAVVSKRDSSPPRSTARARGES